jgi:hypothetical protein
MEVPLEAMILPALKRGRYADQTQMKTAGAGFRSTPRSRAEAISDGLVQLIATVLQRDLAFHVPSHQLTNSPNLGLRRKWTRFSPVGTSCSLG